MLVELVDQVWLATHTHCHSMMSQNVASSEWLAHSPRTWRSECAMVYSAFPHKLTWMKGYEVGQPPNRYSFNCSIIWRRAVEQAFGRLRCTGRLWMVGAWWMAQCLPGMYSSRPSQYLWMHQFMFEPGWLLDESAYIDATPTNLQAPAVIGLASSVREAIARHILRSPHASSTVNIAYGHM